jgi:hypothetical protein
MKIRNWSKFQHYQTGDRAKSPEWIKVYRNLLDDIEWHELDGDSAKMLVNLWMLAAEHGGSLPPVKIIAFRLRCSEKQVNSVLSRLPNWVEVNASGLLADGYQPATLEEKRREVEENRREERVSSSDDPPSTREAFDLYNLKAKTLGLAEARVLTPERSKKLRARLAEHGLPGWKEALAAIERQPFLLGRNNRGWRASLDFLLQPESLNKVREGAYSDDGKPETMQETAARLVRESEEKNGVALEWMQSFDAGGGLEIRANPGQCLPALSAPRGLRGLSADDG